MAISKTPVNPIPWPPTPQKQVPYRLKYVYTTKPGDTFGSIAQHEGIDVWALILFNFQTTDPSEVNWYLKNDLKCTKETRDRKNYIFSGGEQIYIPEGVSPNYWGYGCSPSLWPNASGWTAGAISAYQRWVVQNGEDYVNKKGYTRDCSNFATDVLVDFAKTQHLPVAFYTAKHHRLGMNWAEGWSCTSFRTRQEEFQLPEFNFPITYPIDVPDFNSFASSARKLVKASDLYDLALGNTVRINPNELEPGDLLIVPPNIETLHVQVVLSPEGSIVVGGQTRKVMFIVQGTTFVGNDLPGSSTGEPIAMKAWDLAVPNPKDRSFFYRYYVNNHGKWEEDKGADVILNNFQRRRWNFGMFNRAYGMPAP